jgi:thiamine-monophosphate kinase
MPDDPLEQTIIRHLLKGRRDPSPEVQVDAGDDAAVLSDGTVLTKDVLIEGVHFDDQISAEDLGWKSVAVNASDIGAMGGRPRWALLGLSLPQDIQTDWIEGFSRGLHDALETWKIDLIGGDTTGSPGPIGVSLTLLGHCVRPLRRDQARPGDQVWVSGTLGDAAQGFFHGGEALQALHRPQPPVALGAELAEIDGVHAAMDLSDGLARDLRRLCESSGVGARVEAKDLPAARWLSSGPDRLALQVAFGEDYQLLLCASPDAEQELIRRSKAHGVSLTCIGRIQKDAGVQLIGAAWPAPLFHHFESGAVL